MSVINISRIPEFLDPYYAEIETIWNEIEAAVNDQEARLSILENAPFVINVAAASPLQSTGGSNPTISIQTANALQDGALSASDWNTFNSKLTLSNVLTSNGLVYADASNSINTLSPLIDGQILIGRTGLTPIAGTISGTINQAIVNTGPGTITIGLPQDIAPTSDVEFESVTIGNYLDLAGFVILQKQVSNINDDQLTPLTLIEYNAALYPHSVIEYGIVRGTEVRTGRLYVVTDGTSASIDDTHLDINANDIGVEFNTTVVAGNVRIQYTSTNTGISGSFTYSQRRW